MTPKWDALVAQHVGNQQHLADTIQQLGMQGWELVSAVPFASLPSGVRETMLYFKRPAVGAEPKAETVIYGN